MEVTTEELARFFDTVLPHLNERQRHVLAGAAARMVGNKTAVAEAAGMSRNTVIKAEADVSEGMEPHARQRPPGAGRKAITEVQPGILEDLDRLVHPETRGDPMSLLRWTSKSTYKLAEELVRQGYKIRPTALGACSGGLATPCKLPPSKKKVPVTRTGTTSSGTWAKWHKSSWTGASPP